MCGSSPVAFDKTCSAAVKPVPFPPRTFSTRPLRVRFILFTDSGLDMGLRSVMRLEAYTVLVCAMVCALSTLLQALPQDDSPPLAAPLRCMYVGSNSFPHTE